MSSLRETGAGSPLRTPTPMPLRSTVPWQRPAVPAKFEALPEPEPTTPERSPVPASFPPEPGLALRSTPPMRGSVPASFPGLRPTPMPALLAGLADNEKRVLRDATGKITGALERQGDKLIRWRFIRDAAGLVVKIATAPAEPGDEP